MCVRENEGVDGSRGLCMRGRGVKRRWLWEEEGGRADEANVISGVAACYAS